MISILSRTFLLGLVIAESSTAIKPCIQPPERLVWDPPCHEASVPQTIPLSVPSSDDDNSINNGDVCSVVAHAIFASITVFDMVLLNHGSCNHVEIQKGFFSPSEVAQVLPYNNELVGLWLKEKDIITALEHGFNASVLTKEIPGAYPITAGIQYDLNLGNEVGKRISNLQIMGYDCEYQSLDQDKYYSVLTNNYLAKGGDGYEILPRKTRSVTPTRRLASGIFWEYVETSCVLKKTFTPKEQQVEEKIEETPKVQVEEKVRTRLIYNLQPMYTRNETLPLPGM